MNSFHTPSNLLSSYRNELCEKENDDNIQPYQNNKPNMAELGSYDDLEGLVGQRVSALHVTHNDGRTDLMTHPAYKKSPVKGVVEKGEGEFFVREERPDGHLLTVNAHNFRARAIRVLQTSFSSSHNRD